MALPVSVISSASAALQARGQIGFIDLFTAPLFEAASEAMPGKLGRLACSAVFDVSLTSPPRSPQSCNAIQCNVSTIERSGKLVWKQRRRRPMEPVLKAQSGRSSYPPRCRRMIDSRQSSHSLCLHRCFCRSTLLLTRTKNSALEIHRPISRDRR